MLKMESSTSNNTRLPSPEGSNQYKATKLETASQSSCIKSEGNIEAVKELETCTSSTDGKGPHEVQNDHHSPRTLLRNQGLDTREIDKLFEILMEADSTPYSGFLGHERESVRRFSPYPVHQQLFLQQQQEQERRRQSLSAAASSRYTFPRTFHHNFRSRHMRYVFSDKCRSNSVRRVIAFIDTLTIRLTSTEKDCIEKCVICMSNYNANEELRELRCNHKFHRKCIDEWLVKSSLCPVCRTNLTGTGKASHMWDEYGAAPNLDLDFSHILNHQTSVFENQRPNVPQVPNETD